MIFFYFSGLVGFNLIVEVRVVGFNLIFEVRVESVVPVHIHACTYILLCSDSKHHLQSLSLPSPSTFFFIK
jgi:hypothetical protein